MILSGQPILKFPEHLEHLVEKKDLPGRPAPAKDPVSYHGGKIYRAPNGTKLRVYKRHGDTLDQSLACDWGDKNDRIKTWRLACSIIESDPRPIE